MKISYNNEKDEKKHTRKEIRVEPLRIGAIYLNFRSDSID